MFNPKRHHQIFRAMDHTPTVLQDGVLMTMNGVPVTQLPANVKESLYVPDEYRFLLTGAAPPSGNPFASEQPVPNEIVEKLLDRINRLEALLVGKDGTTMPEPLPTVEDLAPVPDFLAGVKPVVLNSPVVDNYDTRKSGGIVTKTAKGARGPRVVKIGRG